MEVVEIAIATMVDVFAVVVDARAGVLLVCR